MPALDPEKVSGAGQKQKEGQKTEGDPGQKVNAGTHNGLLLCLPVPLNLTQPHNGKESPTAVDWVVGALNSIFKQT